jgi:hypothetical protein
VEITGPTGPALTFVVIGRNLSSGGLAFLHGAPLPIGTPCSVTLFDKEGAPSISPGNIVRCRKVAGRIHELGISFSSKIDVSRFVGDRGQSGARPSIPDSNIQRASVNPTITGLAAAVAKLRTLESEGWPGASVRTVLAEIEMLATLAMKSVPESGNDPRLR